MSAQSCPNNIQVAGLTLLQCVRECYARRFDFGSVRDASDGAEAQIRSASEIGSNVAGIGSLQRSSGKSAS